MDGQPETLSSEPERRRSISWPRPGRRGWIAISLLTVLLASVGVTASLALHNAHQDETINRLRTDLRNAPPTAAAAAVGPAVTGSATFSLPGARGGSFEVVVVAVRPSPGSAALTWLFVYGQHAHPGQRYGVLSDTCDGQYVAAYDLAEGTADRSGALTIVAPNLDINPQAPDAWIMLYRLTDGISLGGVQGPLTGHGARLFPSTPPC